MITFINKFRCKRKPLPEKVKLKIAPLEEITDFEPNSKENEPVSKKIVEIDQEISQTSQTSGENVIISGKFSCQMCSFKTTRQKHLDNHLKKHQDPDLIVIQCQECEFR